MPQIHLLLQMTQLKMKIQQLNLTMVIESYSFLF